MPGAAAWTRGRGSGHTPPRPRPLHFTLAVHLPPRRKRWPPPSPRQLSVRVHRESTGPGAEFGFTFLASSKVESQLFLFLQFGEGLVSSVGEGGRRVFPGACCWVRDDWNWEGRPQAPLDGPSSQASMKVFGMKMHN